MYSKNKKLLRIVFLIGDYGTGGKERQLTEIIKALNKRKYNIHLFMKRSNSYYYDTIKHHLSSCLSLDKKNFSFHDILILKRYLKTVEPDVVFTFSTTLGHFTLLLNFLGLNKYYLINGSIRDAPLKLNFQHRFEKVLYNFYHNVVSNSYSGLKAFGQLGKKGRYVLYNAFDLNRIPLNNKNILRKKFGFNDKFAVVMVASMDSSKDQLSFIYAANEIIGSGKYVDILFYLIGSGRKKNYYENQVKYLGIEKFVSFTGTVNNVEEYFFSANLSVLTSSSFHGEGIPNVVLESLACGTPVIATDNGGTSEILIDKENGYLIKNGDYIELSKKIIFLYKNRDILHELSKKGIKTVSENFSVELAINNFQNIVDKRIIQ